MFDINAIVNTAIAAAVEAATKPLAAQVQCVDTDLAALRERIETLEKNEEALVRRIAALESLSDTLPDPDHHALAQRIAALENNPAQGALDVPHAALIEELDKQEWFWGKVSDFVEKEVIANFSVTDVVGHDAFVQIKERITALESETQGENRYLNRDDVSALIEEAMDEHTSTYDHDDYDSHIGDDDRHIDGSLHDAISDALNNASVSISI